MPQRPAWLAELVEAATEWYEKGSGGRGGDDDRPAKVGRVSREPGNDGWYSLVLRGRTVEADQLDEAFLAPAEGAREVKYSVRDSVQDADVLRVLVARHAPETGLFLWVPGRSRTKLLKSLVDELMKMPVAGIHEAFGRTELDPIDPCPSRRPEFQGEQADAFAACLSSGLQLIWGPPGTGKTEIIARAIQRLGESGKSVLLVSGTNVAVDNALLRAAKALGPDDHGVMVRVGTPHVPDVAADPRLSLGELRRRRLQVKEEERRGVEYEITELKAHDLIRRVEDARRDLADFDPAAYDAARVRLANGSRLEEAGAACAAADQERERAEARENIALGHLQEIRDRWQMLAPQHAALEDARRLAEEIETYQLAQARAAASVFAAEEAVSEAEVALAEVSGGSGSGRLVGRKRRREAEERVAIARQRLSDARRALAQRKEVLETSVPVLHRRLLERNSAAGSVTQRDIEQQWSALCDAENQASASRGAREAAVRRSAALGRRFVEAGAASQPSSLDRDLVDGADRAGIPELHRRLPGWEASARPLWDEIGRLEHRHERLVEELRELGRDAERAILAGAGVVATTLTMLRLKPAVHARPYDMVIVDEAAAASVPDVVYAVSRASSGAVMLGDFLQNAPIIEGLGEPRSRAVDAWLNTDCFAVFGVRNSASARATRGCVALSRQHRFGQTITELANMTAYSGMLVAASNKRSEIVFVDVDGLGDEHTRVRANPEGRGKWWTIGAVIARALGEYHVAVHGESGVGVIAPYRIQKDVIQGMLADSGASPRIEVSTSHGFQGREFDTVVFDLVEDGKGWVAGGRLDGNAYELSGLRLFNVGVTRARYRLYLIGNGAVVDTARAGPLHAVKRLITAGKIEVVRAREVLGLPDPTVDSGPAHDLWDAIRSYVKVVGVYDETVVPEELRTRIEQAERSIWVWSPWVGRRMNDFLPALKAAQDRGVLVRILALPAEDVGGPLHRFIEDLRRQIDHVVFVKREHQKLVVIDERLTFIGSMNVLSHRRGGTVEIMTLIESNDYARRVLRHERAQEFSRVPTCPTCGGRMRVAALTGQGKDRIWRWWCYNTPGDARCLDKLPFPADSDARNQPRRRRPRRS